MKEPWAENHCCSPSLQALRMDEQEANICQPEAPLHLDSLERMLAPHLWKGSQKSFSLGVSEHVSQLDLSFKSNSYHQFIKQIQPKLL